MQGLCSTSRNLIKAECVGKGRLFPGKHYPLIIRSTEASGRYQAKIRSEEGRLRQMIDATQRIPGRLIYYLRARWKPPPFLKRVESLRVQRVYISYFDDVTLFPEGSIEFYGALLMRDVDHSWHSWKLLVVSQEY